MFEAKLIGAGAATIALAGAAIGIGNVFSALIHSVARNPSLAKQLSVALTEAIALFTLLMMAANDDTDSEGDSEEVIELHARIREKTDEVIHSAGHDKLFSQEEDKVALAERLHGESTNIDFLKSLITDLTEHGQNSKSYKDALKLFDFDLNLSPLEPNNYFSIIALFVFAIFILIIVFFWRKKNSKERRLGMIER